VVTDYPDVALIENLRLIFRIAASCLKTVIYMLSPQSVSFLDSLAKESRATYGGVTAEADIVPAPWRHGLGVSSLRMFCSIIPNTAS
jgi:hypothetical protein